jgi:hypothetical protein
LLPSWLNIFVVVVLGLAHVAGGQQQSFDAGIGVTYGLGRAESLEYRVADADIVVLGTFGDAGGGGSARRVNVNVIEAFKGRASSIVTAELKTDDTRPPSAPPAGQCLVFLKRIYPPEKRGQSAPELVMRSYVILDESSGVYGSDFALLTDTDEILTATRRAIAFGESAEKRTAVLLFPPQTPGAAAKPTPTYLAVPVDARLETLGRKWAEARDPQARLRAARALSYFRSPENAEVLKGLLTDTATPYSTGTGKWKRGVYAVREEAYVTLASWGVDVAIPELEGPMYQYRPAYLDWLLFVPVVVMGWVMVGVIVQGSRFRLGRALLGGITLLSMIAGAVLVVLWVRSWFIVDELMYPVRTTYHQVASYRGGVHYLVMTEAEIKDGPLYGAFDLSNVEDQWGLGEHTVVERWERLAFGFAAGRMIGPNQTAHPYRVVRVPYYPLLAMAAVLPALGLSRWFRGWSRANRGLCRRCGYDLRASRGRCPECGEREAAAV